MERSLKLWKTGLSHVSGTPFHFFLPGPIWNQIFSDPNQAKCGYVVQNEYESNVSRCNYITSGHFGFVLSFQVSHYLITLIHDVQQNTLLYPKKTPVVNQNYDINLQMWCSWARRQRHLNYVVPYTGNVLEASNLERINDNKLQISVSL